MGLGWVRLVQWSSYLQSSTSPRKEASTTAWIQPWIIWVIQVDTGLSWVGLNGHPTPYAKEVQQPGFSHGLGDIRDSESCYRLQVTPFKIYTPCGRFWKSVQRGSVNFQMHLSLEYFRIPTNFNPHPNPNSTYFGRDRDSPFLCRSGAPKFLWAP